VNCSAAATPLPTETGTASALSINAGKSIGLLGLLNLANIQAAPVTQSVTHETVSGTREILASASGSVTSARVLSLPLIGSGLVSVDALSYGASVRGSEGTPSAAPQITATSALTVRVYDPVPLLGSGQLGANCATGLSLGPGITASRQGLLTASYCRYVVNPNAAGFTGVSIPVNSGLAGVLTFNATIDILAPQKTAIAGVTGENGEKRWSAEYTPIDISASMDILGLGEVNVDLDLGSVTTEACAGATCL
jgi:hypothetical protein